MKKYRVMTYSLQIAAVIAMFLALIPNWHTEHGSGLNLLGYVWVHRLAIGDPFDPDYIPVNEWWIVWVIFVIALGIGLRAITGVLYSKLEGQLGIILLLSAMLLLSLGWYVVNFSADLRWGFWVELGAIVALFITLLLEFLMPQHTYDEKYLLALPPDHPIRVNLGYYKMCHICGTPNEFGARTCRNCGRRMNVD